MSENLNQEAMLESLAETDELEHEQIKGAEDAQISKWPKGESPRERNNQFLEKHGGKIAPRPSRHTGKGYEGRDVNYKYWVPDREKAEKKAGQRKIEEALAEKTGENVGNPHEADWSPAEWEAVWHALDEPDWVAVLQEMNDAIDAERERGEQDQYILPRDDKGREMPLSWDPKQLREEEARAKKEKYFGKR